VKKESDQTDEKSISEYSDKADPASTTPLGEIKPPETEPGKSGGKSRSKKPWDERPYSWQSTTALDAIDKSPHTGQLSRNRQIYFTITQINSSKEFKGNPTMQISKGLIARISGLSIRTVFEGLAELEKAGVIHVQKNFDEKEKRYDASTYTLISFKKLPSGDKNHTPVATKGPRQLPNVNKKETKTFSQPKRQRKKVFVSPVKKNRHGSKPSSGLGREVLPQPIQTKTVDTPKPVVAPTPQTKIPADREAFRVEEIAKLIWTFDLPQELHGTVLQCDAWNGEDWIVIKVPTEYSQDVPSLMRLVKSSEWAIKSNAEVRIYTSNNLT
jgi:hypothetical protein